MAFREATTSPYISTEHANTFPKTQKSPRGNLEEGLRYSPLNTVANEHSLATWCLRELSLRG